MCIQIIQVVFAFLNLRSRNKDELISRRDNLAQVICAAMLIWLLFSWILLCSVHHHLCMLAFHGLICDIHHLHQSHHDQQQHTNRQILITLFWHFDYRWHSTVWTPCCWLIMFSPFAFYLQHFHFPLSPPNVTPTDNCPSSENRKKF